MENRAFKIEHGLYGLILLIACLLRFTYLGHPPMVEDEARWAVQALALSRGEPFQWGGNPAAILWTAPLFYIFEPTNWLARFWPAVFGSILAITPWLYRKWLGRPQAVVMGFGLALSPGLIAISRQLGSPVIAITTVLLVTAFWLHGAFGRAGISGGLSLLSGAPIWHGILLTKVSAIWVARSWRKDFRDVISSFAFGGTTGWKPALRNLAITIVLFGTLFLVAPSGLTAIGGSMVQYLRGWTLGYPVSIAQMVAGWLAYEPLATFLALICLVNGLRKKDLLSGALGKMWLVSAMLVLLYPGRQVGDLAWMFIPIWGLASLEIVRRYEDIKEDRAAVLAQALLSLLLLVFGTYNVVSLVNRTGLSELEGRIRWISMAGSLLTVILIFMLVAWGWSVRAGRAGLLLGLSTMLGVIMLSAAWSSSGLGRNPAAEAWLPSPFFKDADLLDNTLTQVSQRTAGDRTGVDLQVFAPGSDSIRWALRRHRNITYPNQLKADTRPSVMITSHEDITGAADNYTGQDMILEQWPAWRELTARDWMIWLLYRQAPMEDKHLFLWLRTDLFPGQEAVTIEGQP